MDLYEDFTFLGEATRVQLEPAGLMLECDGAQVEVRVLAADLVRVRMVPPFRSGRAGRGSYAVIKEDWPPVRCEVEQGRGQLRLATPQLVVQVDTSPVRIAFLRPDGRCISRDLPERGMGWRRDGVACWKELAADEHLYGLGDKLGPLDRRGRTVALWNTDVVPHLPNTDPLYKSIPFLIGLRRGEAYGLFFDNTFRSRFDLGRSEAGAYAFGAEGGEMDYYFFAGPDMKAVLARYTALTGRMPLVPLWALGYHQSRYSYTSREEVESVARALRELEIPCDALYLDIHYMDGFRVFTFDPERFPDPGAMIEGLRRQGFRVVTILDPGVKIDPQSEMFREGKEGRFWAVRPGGEPYTGTVWPGEVHFPDFTRPEVRHWWARWHRVLFEAGVEGIWNDMNEPADFSGPGKTLPESVEFGPPEAPLSHREVHNVYGHLMSEATVEAYARYRPGRRPFIITRAAYAGTQRNAVVWTGDNSSWWEHLLQAIPQCLNIGLSGFPFVGVDVGGFVDDCDGELLTRWTQLGAFMPLFRNHSALGTRQQEPYAFGEPFLSICRRFIQLRYRLIPYLYTLLRQASQAGTPVLRPMVMEFPEDPATYRLTDQFMVGSELLVAPVYVPGAVSRSLYLPAGGWVDLWTGKEYEGGGFIAAEAPLERIPLFLRRGALVPYGPVMAHTGEKPPAVEELDLYPAEAGSFTLYLDDGESLAYREGAWAQVRFGYRLEGAGGTASSGATGTSRPGDTGSAGRTVLTLTAQVEQGEGGSSGQGGYAVQLPVRVVRVNGWPSPPVEVRLSSGGEPVVLEAVDNPGVLREGRRGWHYDPAHRRLYIGLQADVTSGGPEVRLSVVR